MMTVTIPTLLVILLIGAIAGWLAGLVVKGYGQGVLMLTSWLLPKTGLYIGTGFIATTINATIGAVILLLLLRLFSRR